MKSFIIYKDALQVLDELDDAQAGRLFKAIKAYQLGDAELEEMLSDIVTRLAFMPFKSNFERDIEKYNDKVERLRNNVATKSTRNRDDIGGVNVNVNVNDNVNAKEKVKEKDILTDVQKEKEKVTAAAAATNERKKKFYDLLIPFVGTYGKEMIREFFDYWSEPNRSGSHMRYELERTWDLNLRLKTWARRDKPPRGRKDSMSVGVVLHNTDEDYEKTRKQLW